MQARSLRSGWSRCTSRGSARTTSRDRHSTPCSGSTSGPSNVHRIAPANVTAELNGENGQQEHEPELGEQGVATKVEHYTYNEPKVIDRRVVAVLFGKDDVVTSVKQYGLKDGKVVDLESKTTPTYGRELTILEQLLGNIGAIPTDVFTSE